MDALTATSVDEAVRSRIAERIGRPFLWSFGVIVVLSFLVAVVFLVPTQPTRLLGPVLGILLTGAATLPARRGDWPSSLRVLLLGTALTITVHGLLNGLTVFGFWLPLAVLPVVVLLFGSRGAMVLLAWLATTVVVAWSLEKAGWIVPGENPRWLVGLVVVVFTGVGSALTITPVKMLTEALEESERERQAAERARAAGAEADRRFRAVFEQSSSALCLVTEDGSLVHANRQAQRLLADDDDEALERLGAGRLFSEADRDVLRERLRMASQGVASAFEVTRSWPGSPREEVHAIRVSPYRDDANTATMMLVEMQDVTEVVDTRRELAHLRQLESLGRMAGSVAHDFNNLLGAIVSASEELGDDPVVADDADRSELLGVLQGAATQAVALTAQLLAFGRRDRPASERLDVTTLMEESLRLVRHVVPLPTHIEADLESTDAQLIGDGPALQNAILNLALNARDAMPDGGELRILTRVIDLEPGWASSLPNPVRPGPALHISVADTGQGIDPAVLPRIFEPFFTTKARGSGTGLGLSTVHGTVRRHGGALTVETEPGRGTTFELILPLANDARPSQPPPPARPSTPPSKRGTVLLVDDERVIRKATSRVLASAGFEVVTAASAEEARVRLAQSPGIDLVLTDLSMPGESGWELARSLREARPDLPIVFMSGYVLVANDEPAPAGAEIPLLRKPFRRDELLETLAAAAG